jgi:ribosomal protein L37AE/L43A
MANRKKRREMIPVWRCTGCGKEMTDGAAVHWLYCPDVNSKMLRVGCTAPCCGS